MTTRTTFSSRSINVQGSIDVGEDGFFGDNSTHEVLEKDNTLFILEKDSAENSSVFIGNYAMGKGVNFFTNNRITNSSISIGSINGVRFMGSEFGGLSNKREKSQKKEDVYEKYYLTSEILLISTSSPGTIVIHEKFVSTNLVVNNAGAGTIQLPQKSYESLLLTVSGTGHIKMKKSDVKNACLLMSSTGSIDGGDSDMSTVNASVSGTGRVHNFCVTSIGVLSMSGCGNIHARKLEEAVVFQDVSGTGKIQIE
jgi:hypothetical protein